MVDIRREDMLWAAYIKKSDADEAHDSQRVFIIVKKGPHLEGAWFHGVGFWVCDSDMKKKLKKPGNPDLVEEWIHGSNIDHVRSLMYKPR